MKYAKKAVTSWKSSSVAFALKCLPMLKSVVVARHSSVTSVSTNQKISMAKTIMFHYVRLAEKIQSIRRSIKDKTRLYNSILSLTIIAVQ